MDSCDEDILEEYKHYGVEVIREANQECAHHYSLDEPWRITWGCHMIQDSTDFTKALLMVKERINEGHLPNDKEGCAY